LVNLSYRLPASVILGKRAGQRECIANNILD
jgi:hypothetical protein